MTNGNTGEAGARHRESRRITVSVRMTLGVCAGVIVALALPIGACTGSRDQAAQPPTEAQPQQPAETTGKAQVIGPSGVRLIHPDIYVANPPPGQPTPQRQPDIDQSKLLANVYSLGEVLEAGQNLFNSPFLPDHGHGEGKQGPRSLQRQFWNPRGATSEQDAWPFLRVNGLDSQSCFECHNTMGAYTPSGAKTVAQVRKPGSQGGSSGAASTAFINDQFPEYSGQPNSVMTKFARNSPHAFGTGYTQRLATEMTTELKAQAQSARVAGTRNPGAPQSIDLASKGVTFGTFSTTCTSGELASCTDDTRQVTGVQGDLVVRPFQFGGIASSMRHFVRDALDFHFSVQAVEKVGDKDCDLDGLSSEITVGNVTALTSYVTMFRPPAQVIDQAKSDSIKRGRALMDQIGCTECHRATMPIEKALLTVMTPPAVPPDAPCPQEVSSLLNPVSREQHDIHRETDHYVRAAMAHPALAATPQNATPQQIYTAIKAHLHTAGLVDLAQDNYQIDLSLTNIAQRDVPAYAWPRLPSSQNNGVDVPLFSDLKLHYMGEALSDDYPQPTDIAGYAAQPGYYVTRVLWGIGDTDPYMHDGRARTLRDAIQLHGAEGSEAATAAASFAALSPADQQALLDFLQSLRLPIAQGMVQPEYIGG